MVHMYSLSFYTYFFYANKQKYVQQSKKRFWDKIGVLNKTATITVAHSNYSA